MKQPTTTSNDPGNHSEDDITEHPSMNINNWLVVELSLWKISAKVNQPTIPNT